MADENTTFRPATEGAGNDLIKAVNNLYSSLTGEEETTHPHETITPGDDDKTIWLTETTARKLAEAINILANKIGDRKENTLTANINDRDYSYNTYGKQSYKIFAPHDNGQQGQALTANVPEGDEEPIPQWGNEVGGVELKDGYIKGVNFEATEDEMAFGEGFRVDAEGNTEIGGNTNIDGNTTIIGDVSIKKDTEANGGNLEVEGTLTAKGKATLSGGTETTDITADSITVGNTKIEDDKITCEQLEGNAKTADDLTKVLSVAHGGTGVNQLGSLYFNSGCLSLVDNLHTSLFFDGIFSSTAVSAQSGSWGSDLFYEFGNSCAYRMFPVSGIYVNDAGDEYPLVALEFDLSESTDGGHNYARLSVYLLYLSNSQIVRLHISEISSGAYESHGDAIKDVEAGLNRVFSLSSITSTQIAICN